MEIKVKLDEKTGKAFDWYVMQTHFWGCNDQRQKSYEEYASYIIKNWLEMEKENPQDAITMIKDEMKLLLE